MNREKLTADLADFQKSMREVIEKKGHDYANADVHSNFKKVAQMTDTSVEKVLVSALATKVARLSELTSGNKMPNFESMEDSCLDLANYAFHLYVHLNSRNILRNKDSENGC